MSIPLRIAVTAALLSTALPSALSAATAPPTRSGVDRTAHVSFTLTGRSLLINLRPVDGQPNPLMDSVPGTKAVAACRGTSPKDGRTRNTSADLEWPAGQSTLTVRMNRDVSDRPVWCLLEATDGADIAVTFKMRIPNPSGAGSRR